MTLQQETPSMASSTNSSTPLAMTAKKETWEEIGARKRAALLASIPEEWRVPSELLPPDSQDDVTGWPASSGWFTAEELAITELTASELVPKLASGALKSVVVTRAFCKRAAAAHQLVRVRSEKPQDNLTDSVTDKLPQRNMLCSRPRDSRGTRRSSRPHWEAGGTSPRTACLIERQFQPQGP